MADNDSNNMGSVILAIIAIVAILAVAFYAIRLLWAEPAGTDNILLPPAVPDDIDVNLPGPGNGGNP